ncbi:terminase TerL endonuclease subunit [Criibacterium bergeronii]|uniref:Terminase large subunit n=1 Tax=Criibacterium bergeronii TaxID=1871336 RepID=A0A371IJP9_9FIRM|nr:terminase TerL endonuclease subunit [Criibacterium bergeronii]RDY20718.1 terminase large subunit [Criibacterium bergeronii]
MRGKKYHEYLQEWIDCVEKGKYYTCNEQKQLIKFIKPILDSDNVIFKPEIVEEYVKITEKYFFKLMPDQKFYASLIFGLFYKGGFDDDKNADNCDNLRLVFNQIFIMAGRGWGKNGFISSLAFFMTSANYGVEKYHVHIVAMSEEQARTSFQDCYDVISDMGEKGKRIYDYNLQKIRCKKTKSEIKYKTSNANTKDGGRPGCVIFDEVHAYENYQNIKVFTGGLGKVAYPRRIYITTDGEVRDGVLDDYKQRARQILCGEIEHKGFLPIIAKLDTIQEVGKPYLWEKANLRIDFSPDLKTEIETQYYEMLQNESMKEAFITKRMNLPYVSKVKTVCTWDDLIFACQGHEWLDLKGVECIGSIDFADLRDFASVGLRWKYKGKTYFRQHTFIHETSLQLTKFNIDIDECVKKGWATIVPAYKYPTISADLIADWFDEQAKQGYYVSKIKADSFRIQAIKEALQKRGLPEIIEVRSGSYSHNKVAPTIDVLFANKTLVLEDDKLMRWFVWNVKREVDKKGNVTYLKLEPIKRKTDGFFCFLHSLIDDDLQDYGVEGNTMNLGVYTY